MCPFIHHTDMTVIHCIIIGVLIFWQTIPAYLAIGEIQMMHCMQLKANQIIANSKIYPPTKDSRV